MQSQRKLKVIQPDQLKGQPLAGKKIIKVLSGQDLQSLEHNWVHKTNDLLQQQPHSSASSRIKRFIDVVGAIAGLIITAIIFIPIAMAIYIDSPGAILYSQIRCGLQGKPFRIWKFRTMCTDADRKQHLVENEAEGHVFKNKNDPRVTRVGKFLRSTSLDEFPQFWNVLKGDMSLVGTRPPTPNEVEKYEGHHFQRLLVKPGITGEWQVRGRSGVKSFDDIVRLDIDYQRKWSPLYDLILIIQTIGVVFKRDGAY
jgi:lipopolysaccharide/colanic/teichoic acid biosynthesis glycosyltransferase